MSEQFKPLKIGEVDSDGKFTPVSRDDLSALPEDVREAWQRIVADEQRPEDFECVQAELLRLSGSLTARQTIDAISRAERAEAELAALQARLDALMLEFCPDDMTDEQRAAWAARQKPVEE